MCDLYLHCTVPDPGPDSIFIGFSSNVSTLYVGTVLTMTCSVVLPNELDIQATALIAWSPFTVYSDSNIQINGTAQFLNTSVYQSTLTFNPVLHQHTNQYACYGIFVPETTEELEYVLPNSGTSANLTVEITPQGRGA